MHTVIPAGTLPKQTEPLPVGLVRGYKAVHAGFPRRRAYQIVMAVAKLAPKLRELHPLWKIWSPELMVAGLSDENVHPGAKKAFVELGWWDRAKELSRHDLSKIIFFEDSGPHTAGQCPIGVS